MAFDPSKATRAKTTNLATRVGYADPNGNPFSQTTTPVAGGFAPVVTPKAANDYNTPTFGTVPGPYDKLRQQLKSQNPGIPASFIDNEVDNLNSGRTTQKNGASGANPNDINGVQFIITTEWRSEPNRDNFIKQDADAKASQGLGDVIQGATAANAQITDNQAQANGNYWAQHVAPALQGASDAVGNQKAVDATQQARVDNATGTYQGTLAANQAGRVADANSTNSYLTGLANDFNTFTGNTNASNSQFATQFAPIANQANSANSGLVSDLFGATNSTNAANSGLASNLWNATNSTNASNLNYGSQLTSAANSINANQTGLYNTLAGQASSINANQTGLFNTLSGQASSINNNQTQLFNELAQQASASNNALQGANNDFQGQLSELNDAQNQANDLFQGQLGDLNGMDRASLGRYMDETNPLMGALEAKGSDPADIARQQDVIGRYEELSHPQTTAQERLVAELARRKFENDDQSNREALMQQLRGRGLQSGGLVVAGLQSANQQTSNDRQMSELGLNAAAQQRALQGMAGYGNESNVLRNADDAMHNFQDQYAQNDMIRRGNLSGQREQLNLAETRQEGDRYDQGFNAASETNNYNTQRDALGFDANRNTINDNYNRDESVFNAGTVTNNNNYNRDESVFNAGTVTNNANYGRDESVFNAGTVTNNNNYGRTSDAIKTNVGINQSNLGNTQAATNTNFNINQGNLGNTQFATTTGIGVNNQNADRSRQSVLDNIGVNQTNLGNQGVATGLLGTTAAGNSARTQGVLNSGDTSAKSALDATGAAATFATGNAANEAGSAQGNAGTQLSGGTTFSTLGQASADQQRKDVDTWLALHGYKSAADAAGKQV